MAAAEKSKSGAAVPAELAAPDPDATVRIDAEEYARLDAEARAIAEKRDEERLALEHSAQADRDAQAERETVERAWREQEEYARGVAELKKKIARSESRRARSIVAAVLLAIVALGVFLYNRELAQDR